MDEALTVIRTFPNDPEASLAQAVLDANGIGSVLIRDNAGGMMPWLNTLHPVRLAVRAADAELAERLLGGLPERGGDDGDGGEAA
jgi:hypothetical protein